MPCPPPAKEDHAASDISIICMPTAAGSDSTSATATCGGEPPYLSDGPRGGLAEAALDRCVLRDRSVATRPVRTRLVLVFTASVENPCFAHVTTVARTARRMHAPSTVHTQFDHAGHAGTGPECWFSSGEAGERAEGVARGLKQGNPCFDSKEINSVSG